MRVVVFGFNNSDENYIKYGSVVRESKISRIYLDLLIKEAVQLDYIRLDEDGDLCITEKGKMYAIENKLT